MNIIRGLSMYAIPIILLIILSIGLYREIKVYDVFIEGAKEGMLTVFKIIPSLVGLMVAIGVFRASGALDLIVFAVKPIVGIFGIPAETLPIILLRPISGSASLALLSDIFKLHGPDSFIGRISSTLSGSTETIFYTLAVYFGAVGIKNIRYTLLIALIANIAGVIATVLICSAIFA